MINLSDIDVTKSPKIRLYQNAEAVVDYTEAYRRKEDLPPIVVAEKDPGKFILADGHHRVEAARDAGLKKIKAEVIAGGHDAALLFALSANTKHGVQRTGADKRHAIEIALEKFPDRSSRVIAKMCAVDDGTVAKVKRQIKAQDDRDKAAKKLKAMEAPADDAVQQPTPSAMPEPAETVIGLDGKHYPAGRKPKGVSPEEWTARNSAAESNRAGESLALDQAPTLTDFIVLVREASMKLRPEDRKLVPEKLRSIADQLELPTGPVAVSA